MTQVKAEAFNFPTVFPLPYRSMTPHLLCMVFNFGAERGSNCFVALIQKQNHSVHYQQGSLL